MTVVALLGWFDPRDAAAQFWVAFGSLLLAGVGAIYGGVRTLLVRRNERKLLLYQVITDVGLINNQKDLGNDIRLTFDGHVVNDARLKMVRLTNAGGQTVSRDDFDKGPIRIQFEPPALMRGAVHSMGPGDPIPEDQLKNLIRLGPADGNRLHGYVELPDLTLNPREWVNLKFLTRGPRDMQMHVFGHVIGGGIRESPARPQLVTRRRVGAAVVVAAFIVGLLASNGVGLIAAFVRGDCAIGPVPLTVGGSTAFQPTAQAEATRYHAGCPVAVFSVSGGASGTGLRMLEMGGLDVADSELSAREAGYSSANFQEHRVAVIVFSLIVNRDVTGVTSLTRTQTTGIYTGQITNWRAVGGPDLPITIVGRPADSGTHGAFDRFVLDPNAQERVPVVESSTQGVVDRVRTTPGAIGYAELGAANQAHQDVVSLAIDSNPPTIGLVRSDAYQFWAIERMYTRPNADRLSQSFIDYVTRDIQASDTFVPLRDVPDDVLGTHS